MSSRAKTVLAATSPKTLFLISVNNFNLLSKFETQHENIKSIGWNSDNSYLAYCGSENFLSLSTSINPVYTQKVAANADQHILYFSRNKAETLITGGTKGASMLWSIKGFQTAPNKGFSHESSAMTTAITLNNTDTFMCLGVHPNNIESCSIILFNIEERSLAPLLSIPMKSCQIPSYLSFSPINKQHIGCSTSLGDFIIYDIQTGGIHMEFKHGKPCPSISFSFLSSNEKNVAHALSDGSVVLYDIHNRRSVSTINTSTTLSSFTFMDNGFHFIAGTEEGKIYQYDIRSYTYPVDVINIGSSINTLAVQHGLPTFPGPNISPFSAESPSGFKSPPLLPRKSIPDASHERSNLNDKKTKTKASIFSLFNSPAHKMIKKIPHDVSTDEYSKVKPPSSSEQEPIVLKQNSPSNLDHNSIRSNKNSDFLMKTSNESSLQNQKILLEEPYQDLPNQITDEHLLLDQMALMDLHESIHVHVRDLTFDMTRQLYSQTNELKNFFTQLIADSNKREQELMDENIRLRKEILELREYIRNIQSKPPNA